MTNWNQVHEDIQKEKETIKDKIKEVENYCKTLIYQNDIGLVYTKLEEDIIKNRFMVYYGSRHKFITFEEAGIKPITGLKYLA